MVVDLDELNVGELLEVECERARNIVERAVGLTTACEVDVRDTVGKFEFAVACEAIEDDGKSFVAFDVAGTFEEFVQDPADQVLRGRNKTRHWDLVGQFAVNEPFVICEVDIHFHVERCARGRGGTRGGRCDGLCEGWRL